MENQVKKTIQESVAEKIANSGNNVAEIVIDKMVQVEIDKRVEIISKAITKLDSLEKDFKKINRPDVKTYVNNEPVDSMSSNRYEEIKKSKENLEKITKLIDEALDKNNADSYTKLNECLSK